MTQLEVMTAIVAAFAACLIGGAAYASHKVKVLGREIEVLRAGRRAPAE